MIIDTREIETAIEEELEATPRHFDFKVTKREKDGSVWKIFVDLNMARCPGLDESLEGSSAWWGGPPKGAADVLSVIPEDEQINLRFATTIPPEPGKLIRLYPARYLDALLSLWRDNDWAIRSKRWGEDALQRNDYSASNVPHRRGFDWLRKKQMEALNLPGFKASLLWGPPGTGKTTTLGVVLAQYILNFPSNRVLLLSTTNSAVDQALVKVDDALIEAKCSSRRSNSSDCKRVGIHFIASYYKDREHLLPVKDQTLVKKLAELEAKRPDSREVQEDAAWKGEIERFREEIRAQSLRVLDQAMVVAMTTTRAVFTHGDLLNCAPYDLIVFDEASQVGLAHALALVPLGRRSLFAGDLMQLAPIVRSDHPLAIKWLGKSIFNFLSLTANHTVLLNEQSRMAKHLCELVSGLFYDGQLIVAEDCRKNSEWEKDRQVSIIPEVGSSRLGLLHIENEGKWSNKYNGPIRYESSRKIIEIVSHLLRTLKEDDILIITPFKAQRTLIKSHLHKEGLRKIAVSTVHRAQGSERHTVIFDPAMGNNDFLKTEDAERLINVALSRAKARLLVLLSSGDEGNPLFERLKWLAQPGIRKAECIPVRKLVALPGFPESAIGKVMSIDNMQGEVTGVSADGSMLHVKDLGTGKARKFKISVLIDNFGVTEAGMTS